MEQNLNLYQAFYEVARCRNFSVAAQKLYISQPAISKTISRLEKNLNTTLFNRSSRGVSLTSEGETLYKYVEEALLSIQSAEDMLKSLNAQGISRLSIGVSTTLCKYVLLPLLKDFINRYPNIKITINCQSTMETISSLKEGRIDLGLVGIPYGANSELLTVSYLPLKTIEDIFVTTQNYLASFTHKCKADLTVNSEFLNNASFIMLDKGNISRKHTDAFLTELNITFQNIIEVNNMDLCIDFAKAGLGIACVITDFVKEDLQSEILCELKFKHRIPKRQIGFAYFNKSPLSDSMQTLIQYYRSSVQ